MRIFICTSKHLYSKIKDIKDKLEKQGHEIILPNSYEDPMQEERIKKQSKVEHQKFKEKMFESQIKKIQESDALLVVNYKKEDQENYIGGSVLLEMYEAWKLKRKIYLLNQIPNNIYVI